MKPIHARAGGYPVMLSFDDGPRPGSTERILDVLAGRGLQPDRPLRAAFFTLAHNPPGWLARRLLFAPYEIWTEKGSLVRHPDLARRIIEEGHWLGNHGATHFWPRWPWYRNPRRVEAQLLEWERVADAVVPAWRGRSARLARAPYLSRTSAWRAATARTGFTELGGMTTGDADPRAACDDVRRTLLTRLERERRLAEQTSRPVLLIFHDIRELTAECLDGWLDAISAAGYALTDFDPDRL
ncbi:polysaccharide deacetylase family protein [Guyparkeria halophila]|uniref:Polysaccharide deacetylase family protein n=1 Tax=Guyparkeria halophila TaxID=47960 RepID=A0ABZ0YT34_9GAMM|nr:polysaccharide deacetylase family protein [Guyparkeria halophila]WQH15328.1 polysaccharide deacetylase family protein [Guyparkeria halophila]